MNSCRSSNHILKLAHAHAVLPAEGRNVLPRPLHIDDGKIHLFLLSAPEPNSIGRLEIVNRFHDIDHIHRIANHIDDVCE